MSNPMTDTIEELERLLAAATEGHWRYSRSITTHDGQYDYGISSNGEKVVAEAFGRSAAGTTLPAESNAALIVALVNAAPALIASLKAVTAERDAMAEALTKIANHPLNLSRGEPNDARQAEWESGEDYGTRRAAQVARKALESSQ
tara:strand:+ start:2498 stop:2935 length:438 start_codon:yes stop_codon:yes gene_type:complete